MLRLLLAVIFLIGPEEFTSLSQAAMDYSQISSQAWGRAGDTIYYEYDDNGSVTVKRTHDGTNDIRRVDYAYNLQNRLSRTTVTTYTAGVPDAVVTITEYSYSPSGVRTSKRTWTQTTGQSNHDDVYVSYLNDPSNPTGYSQVLEESTYENDGTTLDDGYS